MVIYGEILFLENAAAGALLLWMTGRLCGCPFTGKRLALGAAMCGVYAFSIFQEDVGIASSLFQKLLFSAVLILLSFGRSERRAFVQRLLVFYVTSFLMGGITMGLAGLLASPAASAGGSFYLEHMTFLHIFSGCGATVLTVRLTLSFLRERRHRFRTRVPVAVIYEGKEIEGEGFVDTGNLLMDPLEGRPVCLVTESFWRKLTRAAGGSPPSETLRKIPYRTAAGEEGELSVIPPEQIRIGGESGGRGCRVTLAVVKDGEKGRPWGDHVEILLHGWLMDEAFGDCEKVGMGHETVPKCDDVAS